MNHCGFSGFVGQDPTTGVTKNGKPWARFSLGVTEYMGKNPDGTPKKRTDWIPCVFFGSASMHQFIGKGKFIIVEGSLHNNNFEDSNGVQHWQHQVIVRELSLGPKMDMKSDESHGSAESTEQTFDDDDIPF